MFSLPSYAAGHRSRSLPHPVDNRIVGRAGTPVLFKVLESSFTARVAGATDQIRSWSTSYASFFWLLLDHWSAYWAAVSISSVKWGRYVLSRFSSRRQALGLRGGRRSARFLEFVAHSAAVGLERGVLPRRPTVDITGVRVSEPAPVAQRLR